MIEEGFFGDMKDKFQQKFKMGDYKEVEGLEERLKEYEELYKHCKMLLFEDSENDFSFKFFENYIENVLKPSKRNVKIELDSLLTNLSQLNKEQYDNLKQEFKIAKSALTHLYTYTIKMNNKLQHKYLMLYNPRLLAKGMNMNIKKTQNVIEQNLSEVNLILNNTKSFLTTAKKVFESIKRVKTLDSLVKNLPKYQQALENSI